MILAELMTICLTLRPLFLPKYHSKFLIAIYLKVFFPYDVVRTLGICKFPLEANDDWYLWEIDENANQLVKKEGNLLSAYLFMKRQL